MDNDLSDLKEEIRARSDIVEIVGQYTRLRRTGKTYVGLCPFHNDRNPSFSVVPHMQIYKCFSCGESGDIFKFIQKKENLSFVETLEFLARRAGITFTRKAQNPEAASEVDEMLELNKLAVAFFRDRLTKSIEAQSYLAGRAVLKETQEQFQIGFAAQDWEALAGYLERRKANLPLAARLGLIRARQTEGSGYYDVYRGRIMFPIQDVSGRIIAFGGRTIVGDDAKYINSDDSRLFHKSKTLYGLNFARKKLSADTPAVFVEGYLDVVTAHQAGFTQCVATLGTSMTEDHARMLARYSPKVVICYDSDSAGIRATLRGSAVWESIGVDGAEVRIALLPKGEDPDSLLRRGDTATFQTALDNAVPRTEFELDLCLSSHDITTEEGRAAALAEAIPIIASVSSLPVRDKYAQRAARLHPSFTMNIDRAITQILAEAQTYRQNHRNTPRDRGYPLTSDANRQPLSEQPKPPTYQPGTMPRTGPQERYQGGGQQGGRSANGRWKQKPQGPAADYTPPSLAPPAVLGVEKAEKQLLRACFEPEWRPLVLAKLAPEQFITAHGRRLFEWIQRTPALEDGSLDPQPLIRRALDEEEAAESSRIMGIGAPSGGPKMSGLIQDVLEDSPFLASNDRLSKAVVDTCIARLVEHHRDLTGRLLKNKLQNLHELPIEQQRACLAEYQQWVRETRGSPS
jgi:DNA primase